VPAETLSLPGSDCSSTQPTGFPQLGPVLEVQVDLRRGPGGPATPFPIITTSSSKADPYFPLLLGSWGLAHSFELSFCFLAAFGARPCIQAGSEAVCRPVGQPSMRPYPLKGSGGRFRKMQDKAISKTPKWGDHDRYLRVRMCFPRHIRKSSPTS
jgi:hypothetical protein